MGFFRFIGANSGKAVNPASAFPDGISFNSAIPNHLAKFDGFSQKTGISGTHNMDEFMQAAAQNNVKILSQTPSPTNGVTQIEYQIPSLDRAGNIAVDAVGAPLYKNQRFVKTLYNPHVIPDSKIIKLGQQAAGSGYQSAISNGLKAYNADAGGVPFRIYVDPKTGIVTNFHPR